MRKVYRAVVLLTPLFFIINQSAIAGGKTTSDSITVVAEKPDYPDPFTGETPVVVTQFEATKDGNVVHLHWLSEAEFNNDFFTIESSADGKSYEAVAFIEGAGTCFSQSEYSATDEIGGKGTIYYRLVQTTYTGARTILVHTIANSLGSDDDPKISKTTKR